MKENNKRLQDIDYLAFESIHHTTHHLALENNVAKTQKGLIDLKWIADQHMNEEF